MGDVAKQTERRRIAILMLEHLSYSSVSLYLSCPRAWSFRYVEKVKVPASTALVFGGAFHQAIENYIAGGTSGDLVEMWSTAWVEKTRDGAIEWGAETPESFFNEGVRMLTSDDIINTLKKIRPRRDEQGLMIERKVDLRVEGVPIPVIGFVDCIEDDAIADFKTAARQWSDSKVKNEMQPLFYFAALDQMNIKHDWRFRHYAFVKGKTPKAQIIEHSRKPIEAGFLNEMVRGVWRGIDAKCFAPNPTTWKCSPQYCEYWNQCRGKYI